MIEIPVIINLAPAYDFFQKNKGFINHFRHTGSEFLKGGALSSTKISTFWIDGWKSEANQKINPSNPSLTPHKFLTSVVLIEL